ncbi:MAG: flagellar motor switch phosphatase FliY [Lachnospiraceae bacterium]|nr:flagellar motor switch phosphatase FliY [Lachnospiraceae bacterium]MBR5733304.1 flagellar motor switch phosphatase FliY [Lachnospiraceae bacterium]
MDGMLSQEEINALLNGMGSDSSADGAPAGDAGSAGSAAAGGYSDSLTDAEKDAVGEVSNISMGTAATTLSTLLNQKVDITTPKVSYARWDEFLSAYERPCVFIQIYYTCGLDGNNILIMKESDVKIITDLMMGGSGVEMEGDLNELHLSAICEAMNQMMGSSSTSMSAMLDKKIDISPPTASLVDLSSSMDAGEIAEFLTKDFVKVSFRMKIGDLIDSEIMQLYSFDFARDLYSKFMANSGVSEPEPAPAPAPAPAAAPEPAPAAAAPMPQMAPQMAPQMQPQAMPYQMAPVQDVNISPVAFQPFTQVNSPLLSTENIDLLLDVPLEVTAELGRTSKSIKEILDFAPGTIIELNRLAGEPIDVLVNGKFVAKGEVVVIEEAFGIRVTEVVK